MSAFGVRPRLTSASASRAPRLHFALYSAREDVSRRARRFYRLISLSRVCPVFTTLFEQVLQTQSCAGVWPSFDRTSGCVLTSLSLCVWLLAVLPCLPTLKVVSVTCRVCVCVCLRACVLKSVCLPCARECLCCVSHVCINMCAFANVIGMCVCVCVLCHVMFFCSFLQVGFDPHPHMRVPGMPPSLTGIPGGKP